MLESMEIKIIVITTKMASYATMRGLSAAPRNLTYIRQQFLALLDNTSGSVKFICIVIFFSYFLSFSETAVNAVSVTPGFMLPTSLFGIWTPFTFCFLEIHFWEVIVDVVTVGLCGKLIEPLWKGTEMLIFFAIVNIGVAILSTLYYLLLYYCTFDTSFLFDVHIHGLAGYIAGVCVAVKQIMPDHLIFSSPLGKLTNRNIPLSVLLVSLLLWVVGLLDGCHPTMFTSGLLVSWTYLRFYQRHSNGTKGDMADTFCFASFFPNVLQPAVGVISNAIYRVFVKIGICRRTVRQVSLATAPTGVTVALPGLDPHDVERRRQKAMKALNERLGRVETPKLPAPVLPSFSIPIATDSATNDKQRQIDL